VLVALPVLIAVLAEVTPFSLISHLLVVVVARVIADLVVAVAVAVTDYLTALHQVTYQQQLHAKALTEQVTAAVVVVLQVTVLVVVVVEAVLVRHLQLQEQAFYELVAAAVQRQLDLVHLVARVKLVVVTAVAVGILHLAKLILAAVAVQVVALDLRQAETVAQVL
jgi:hypothetical protein